MARPKKYGSDAERLKAWRLKRNPIVSPQSETKLPPPVVETPLVETKPSNHVAPSPSLGLVLSHVPIVACLNCQRRTYNGDNFDSDDCYRAFNRGKPGDPFAQVVSDTKRGRGWELRAKLDALKQEYGEAQRHLDIPQCQAVCSRVNRERQRLIQELWQLERHLPRAEMYWFPVRVMEGA